MKKKSKPENSNISYSIRKESMDTIKKALEVREIKDLNEITLDPDITEPDIIDEAMKGGVKKLVIVLSPTGEIVDEYTQFLIKRVDVEYIE